jgi:protein O-GlcNAc transferase
VRALGFVVLASSLLLTRVSVDAVTVQRAQIEAEAMARRGRYDAAEAALRGALARVPDDPRLWRTLGRVTYLRYAFRRQPEDAGGTIAAYQRAVTANPLDGQALVDLGWAAAQIGEADVAESALRAALARDPHNQHFHYSLGRFLERDERLGEAAEAYRAALAVGPDREIARRLAALGAAP